MFTPALSIGMPAEQQAVSLQQPIDALGRLEKPGLLIRYRWGRRWIGDGGATGFLNGRAAPT
jgi:hypothetical protein